MAADERVGIIYSTRREGTGTREVTRDLDGLIKTVQRAAASFGVVKAAQAALKFARFGGEVQRASRSLDALAQSAGTTGRAITDSIQSAADMTIDRMTAMQVANRAMLMDVAKTPEEFERLSKVAVALGRAMGKDAKSSIDDFVTAAGRQSKMIADNLGLVVSAEDAYERYAKSLGKTVDQLTDAEKKQAFLNEMLRQGEAKMAELGDATMGVAEQYEMLESAVADARAEFALIFAEMVTGEKGARKLADTIRALPQYWRNLHDAGVALSMWIRGDGSLEEMMRQVAATRIEFDHASEIVRYKYTTALEQIEAPTRTAVLATDAYGDSLDELTDRSYDAQAASEALREALEREKRAAEDAVKSHLSLSATLKDADRQQIGRAMVDRLNQALAAGQITLDQYNTAVTEVQLTFGLADAKSITLAQAIENLTGKLAVGQLTASDVDNALDGVVQRLASGEQGAIASSAAMAVFAEAMRQVDQASVNAGRSLDSVMQKLAAMPREKVIKLRYELAAPPAVAPGRIGGEAMQHGGVGAGRLAWVGEAGPELMRIPAGARVYPASVSRSNTLNITQNNTIMDARAAAILQMQQRLAIRRAFERGI